LGFEVKAAVSAKLCLIDTIQNMVRFRFVLGFGVKMRYINLVMQDSIETLNLDEGNLT